MKKLVILIIILVSQCETKAQNFLTPYDTCSSLQQYEGEWMYANNTDTIRVYLKFHRGYSPVFDYVKDYLFGWHQYKHGSTVIESSYANRFTILPFRLDPSSFTSSVLLGSGSCPAQGDLSGTIVDLSQRNELKDVKCQINAAGTIMIWTQRHVEGYGALSGAKGMTLPPTFTLMKQ